MDDATWDEIMSTMTGGEPAAVDDAATDAAAPGADPSLTEEPISEAVVEETPTEPEPVTAEAATPEPETPADPDPTPDWREHPEAKEAIAALEFRNRLVAAAAEAKRIQANNAIQAEFHELADGDAERLQRLNTLAAQIVTPIQEAAQQQFQRAEGVEKSTAALWIAMQSVLSEEQQKQILDEHTTLMGVEGVEVMQRLAFGKRDANQRLSQALSAKDNEIAELKRQLAAKADLTAREQSGADVVDAGGGNSTPPDQREQMRQAETFDEYWAGMTGRAA